MCDCPDAPQDTPTIRERKEALDREAQLLNIKLKNVQLHRQQLQNLCTHPNEYKTSHMGEDCNHCPDCGNCP